MLARLLKWMLLFEGVFWLGLGLAAHAHGRLQPFGVGVIVLCGPLGVRAVWLLGLFAGGLKNTWDPRSPLSLPQLLKLFFREWTALLRVFGLLCPFERRLMGADRLAPLASFSMPVVLVHGYRCNRGIWYWMRSLLESRGHTVATLNLEPLLGDIDDYATQLAARIEAVCKATGAQRVALIGHSMGALTALAYLRRYGTARAAKLITLGGPFGGSWLARLGSGRSALQMVPGNVWLSGLMEGGAPEGLEVTTICSLHDCYVAPADAVLEQAVVVRLPAVGHLEMPWSEPVLQAVCEALDA